MGGEFENIPSKVSGCILLTLSVFTVNKVKEFTGILPKKLSSKFEQVDQELLR